MAGREIPPPGNERDEALALAMGWKQSKLDGNYWCSPYSIVCRFLPAWSTNPALLPDLLAECDKRGWDIHLQTLQFPSPYQNEPRSECTIYCPYPRQRSGYATTRSAALTEAMLRALWAEQEASHE